MVNSQSFCSATIEAFTSSHHGTNVVDREDAFAAIEPCSLIGVPSSVVVWPSEPALQSVSLAVLSLILLAY